MVLKWKWRKATHTWNSWSVFTHPSAHTQQWTHTPWTHTRSSGQPLMLRGPGNSYGFGVLLKGTSLWYWRWRERCTFTPPTDNPCRTETRTHNLWITSLTLLPLGHDFPRLKIVIYAKHCNFWGEFKWVLARTNVFQTIQLKKKEFWISCPSWSNFICIKLNMSLH